MSLIVKAPAPSKKVLNNYRDMKHIVCYSGGHSSALVAIEVVRKYGKENVILVNHDISSNVEHEDIKRFKRDVAKYLGLPITYVNIDGKIASDIPDQFDVCVSISAFKVGQGTELCTSKLKTEPFLLWLSKIPPDECIIYYGFDKSERVRIQRRAGILGAKGYKTEYPLAFWERSILTTKEIGIEPPMSYSKFKHANCIGCLKAGKRHWYITYCLRPDIFKKAKWAESEIGYTIIKGVSMEELEPIFKVMKASGIEANEHEHANTFWAKVRKMNLSLMAEDFSNKPCECII